jgi:hypothetical protein
MEGDECANPCEEQKKCDGKKNESHKQSPCWRQQIDEAKVCKKTAVIVPTDSLNNIILRLSEDAIDDACLRDRRTACGFRSGAPDSNGKELRP